MPDDLSGRKGTCFLSSPDFPSGGVLCVLRGGRAPGEREEDPSGREEAS